MTPSAIRAARRQLGLSVTQFAAALGVQPQTVRRWQSGIREPSVQTVMLIERLVTERAQTAGAGL
jgi:DNA-binding transcriptional regulator YiaG